MKLDHVDENQIRNQAVEAGFSTPELYIQNLLEQDAERLAIQKSIDAYKEGRHRSFDEFDREFRETRGASPRR